MIITLTLNPALDKTAAVDIMRVNALNRLRNITVSAGGKGINVSSVIRNLGGTSLAMGFAGGASGEELLRQITDRGIPHDFVRSRGDTRINLKVIQNGGGLTELNEPGMAPSSGEWAELKKKLLNRAGPGVLFVLAGSLPPGLPDDTYRELCLTLHKTGAQVFVDTDCAPLKLALESPPDFIKPNRDELLRYFGVRNPSEEQLLEMCGKLLATGIKLAAVSLGSEGALFAAEGQMWRAPAVPVTVQSTVGAGDAMVGALAYGIDKGLPLEECFALAMAVSAGAAATPGTQAPSEDSIQELLTRVVLEKVR
ncbi:MAG: 1-phosphofructokinase [Spirochaetaceae bacterium]|jgi:1-phosphofructokinase|nr:1-phosphofructokinase [Spirochaetaceae bacterium]